MKPDGSVEDILRFYDERGYARRIGFGRRPALVVVDFSRAFTGGRSEFPGGDFRQAMMQTVRLLEAARHLGAPVLFTTIAYDEPHRDAGLWGAKVPWLEHCRKGTALVEIDPFLGRLPTERVVVKRFPSAFFDTEVEELLRRAAVDTVVLCGCTTSVCVRATAIDAMQRGYRTIVAAEAVGDFHHDLHVVHLRDLDARYADVMPVDEVLANLSRI